MEKLQERQYTGDIGAKVMNTTEEYTVDNQEITFTPAQHKIWSDLYAGIFQPHFLEHICQEYHQGFELLGLAEHQIPSVADLRSEDHPNISETGILALTLALFPSWFTSRTWPLLDVTTWVMSAM